MKGNKDKCHLIVSTQEPIEIWVVESLIKSSACENCYASKLIINLILKLMSKVFLRTQMTNQELLQELHHAIDVSQKEKAPHEFLL